MDHAWSCWMCGHEENLWGNEGNLSSSIWLLIKWHYLIEELDSVHNEFGKGGGREEGNNFTTMILNEAQLSNQAIHKRFICFIAKNVSFLGGWFGIMCSSRTSIHHPWLLYIVGHCTNLAMQTLSNHNREALGKAYRIHILLLECFAQTHSRFS